MKKKIMQIILLLALGSSLVYLLSARQLPNTHADFTTETVKIENVLRPPIADVSIVEDGDEIEEGGGNRYYIEEEAKIHKNAAIKNKGSVPLAIRVMVLIQLRDYADQLLIGGYEAEKDPETGDMPFLDLSIRLLDEEINWATLPYKWDKRGDYYYLVTKAGKDVLYELKPAEIAKFMKGIQVTRFLEYVMGDEEHGNVGAGANYVKIGEQHYTFDQLHFSIQVVVDSIEYSKAKDWW